MNLNENASQGLKPLWLVFFLIFNNCLKSKFFGQKGRFCLNLSLVATPTSYAT